MFKLSTIWLAMVAILAITAATEAHAMPLGMTRSAAPPTASFLPDGDVALAPLAHVKFCMTSASECAPASTETATEIGVGSFAVLDAVNRDVNRRIRPQMKRSSIGDWAVNPSAGDCNDYAVTKRHLLIQRGLPASALRLAVVVTHWGEGHLVLVARTQVGDYVLDNLSGAVRPWSRTGHRFLKLQTADDPRSWNEVGPAARIVRVAAKAARFPDLEPRTIPHRAVQKNTQSDDEHFWKAL